MNSTTKQMDIEYWERIKREEPIVAINKCEEAAKQMITLLSILITIYVGVVSFGDLLKQPIVMRQSLLFVILPVPFWLLSLLQAIFVLLPRAYSIDRIREDYLKIRQKKHTFLMWSYGLLITSMIALMAVIIIYILYVPPLSPVNP